MKRGFTSGSEGIWELAHIEPERTRSKTEGFTLIELLMVLAILALVAALTLTSLASLNSSQALDKSTVLVSSLVSQARSLTLASREDATYGVYFEESRTTLFKGTSFSSGDPNNFVVEMDPRVRLTDVSFTGSVITFDRLTGKSSGQGTVKVSLSADPAVFKTITVYDTGLPEIN